MTNTLFKFFNGRVSVELVFTPRVRTQWEDFWNNMADTIVRRGGLRSTEGSETVAFIPNTQELVRQFAAGVSTFTPNPAVCDVWLSWSETEREATPPAELHATIKRVVEGRASEVN